MLKFGVHTDQGRQALVVRQGPWAFINVHVESGPDARNRDFRNWQLELLSSRHECDKQHVQVLAGDLNIREGEEQCLIQQHWWDAWNSGHRSSSVDWTWKKDSRGMRFDRCYVHSSDRASAECVLVKRLSEIWDKSLTDHVAIHVALKLKVGDNRADHPASAASGNIASPFHHSKPGMS